MSYSFTVRGADKAAAKAAVAAQLEQVIATQPVHARDRAAAQANADAVIDLLADDDTKDVLIACHGSVTWRNNGAPADVELSGVSVGANAYHADRI